MKKEFPKYMLSDDKTIVRTISPRFSGTVINRFTDKVDIVEVEWQDDDVTEEEKLKTLHQARKWAKYPRPTKASDSPQ